MRNTLSATEYKPHFAGHETFHLRYGWLKKAYDAVVETNDTGKDSKSIFTEDEAIARFGVGKNMVASIRYWANACGIIASNDGTIKTTAFGDLLFSNNGLDPYLENISSLWVIHWILASNIKRTTFYWAFNLFNEGSFEKDRMLNELSWMADKNTWAGFNPKTVSSDITVFLNTYANNNKKGGIQEDSLSSPLAELGLIRPGLNNRHHFGWGAKPTLKNGAFCYALLNFWNEYTSSKTINIQTLMLEPSSPGRVFLMDENDLAERLMNIDEISDGIMSWSETAGLKQVILNGTYTPQAALNLLQTDYKVK